MARAKSSPPHAKTSTPRAKPSPAGYSGTPLPKKLGIKPGTRVLLVGAPPGFEPTLGLLPDDVEVRRGSMSKADTILWFVKSVSELRDGVRNAARSIRGTSGLWIAWPKKSAQKTLGITTDVSEDAVRDAGLAAGLVDFKVCAIDATWSGLAFAKRVAKS